MTDSFVVDRSLIVLPPGDGRLSVQMLAGTIGQKRNFAEGDLHFRCANAYDGVFRKKL
jgi:hypothetical protein